MSRGRCSTTEAVNLLVPAFSPTAAADELTRAIHGGRCRPYCNGKMIPSNLAPRLMVVVRFENDGSWVARIENTAYTAAQPVDVWEFEIDEVKALLADKLPTAQAHEGSAATWIKHVCPNDEWGLMSAKDVHRKVLQKAKELEINPPSYSAVAAALRKLKPQT